MVNFRDIKGALLIRDNGIRSIKGGGVMLEIIRG